MIVNIIVKAIPPREPPTTAVKEFFKYGCRVKARG
jgi:hypothetical protein